MDDDGSAARRDDPRRERELRVRIGHSEDGLAQTDQDVRWRVTGQDSIHAWRKDAEVDCDIRQCGRAIAGIDVETDLEWLERRWYRADLRVDAAIRDGGDVRNNRSSLSRVRRI